MGVEALRSDRKGATRVSSLGGRRDLRAWHRFWTDDGESGKEK